MDRIHRAHLVLKDLMQFKKLISCLRLAELGRGGRVDILNDIRVNFDSCRVCFNQSLVESVLVLATLCTLARTKQLLG